MMMAIVERTTIRSSDSNIRCASRDRQTGRQPRIVKRQDRTPPQREREEEKPDPAHAHPRSDGDPMKRLSARLVRRRDQIREIDEAEHRQITGDDREDLQIALHAPQEEQKYGD